MKPQTQNLGTIGKCIYCGDSSSKLSNEHIIPIALNGPFVLTSASCQKCASITSKFEMDVLRASLIQARLGLNMYTRHPSRRPPTYEIIGIRNGKEIKIQVPIEDLPAMITLLLYPPPAHLEKRPYKRGIQIFGAQLHSFSEPSLDQFTAKYGIQGLKVHHHYKGLSFERLLAKIAYGFAVASYGIDSIDEKYVLSSILGEKEDIGLWLGCATQKRLDSKPGAHQVEFYEKNNEIICHLQLFSFPDVPEYQIVVGSLK